MTATIRIWVEREDALSSHYPWTADIPSRTRSQPFRRGLPYGSLRFGPGTPMAPTEADLRFAVWQKAEGVMPGELIIYERQYELARADA